MALTFIGGINGVGKTSVAELICSLDNRFRVIKGSQVMMQRLGIENDYDAFRAMDENVKNAEFINLLNELRDAKGSTIVTGHFVKILDGTLSPSLGPWYSICNRIILLTSNPKMILKRIMVDEAQSMRVNRRLFSSYMTSHNLQVAFLHNAQDLSRSVLESIQETASIDTAVFYNQQGNLYDCTAQIISYLSNSSQIR